jgi:hypothetical protein
MTRLALNKNYLTINELLNRWNHTFDDFQYIIENSTLDMYVRPLVLRATLPNQYVEKLEHCPLEPNKVCKLVHEKQHLIKIQDFQDSHVKPKADIIFEIAIGDIVILMADIEELEKEYFGEQNTKLEIISPDYQKIKINDINFSFGTKQALIIKYLHEQFMSDDPWVHGKKLMSVAGSSSWKIQALFGSHKNWRDVIKSDGRGYYKINL